LYYRRRSQQEQLLVPPLTGDMLFSRLSISLLNNTLNLQIDYQGYSLTRASSSDSRYPPVANQKGVHEEHPFPVILNIKYRQTLLFKSCRAANYQIATWTILLPE
tara:strand:+ start:116 stop:430 length:315 start_codon:yes stop_codon:yes gene_type:complete